MPGADAPDYLTVQAGDAPTPVIDPRQRHAAALLLAAVRLPAPVVACTEAWLEAAQVYPGATVADLNCGDRRASLERARDLIDQLLGEEDLP